MGREQVSAAINAIETLIATLDTWVLVFAGFVAIGVVGEAILGVWHWRLDGRLRDLRHTEAQLHESEIANANATAATANERAAALEKDAAQARAEQERLKTQISWRRITKEQHDEIVSNLRGRRLAITIKWPASDPEAGVFADDIGKTLRDAGMTLSGEPFISDTPVFGLGVSKMPRGDQVPSDDWIALADAFKKAGWIFGLAEPAERLTITVGSKKPPF